MFSKTILSLIASAMLFTGSVAAAEPVRIIFETDMGNDVDDVLALDMLYKYQDAGKIQLLLISNNKGNAYSAPFIHLMIDFYGWSDHGQQPDFAGDEFPARQFAVSVRGRIQQPFEVGQESDGDDHDAAVGLCREDLPVFFHGIECLRRRCRKDA